MGHGLSSWTSSRYGLLTAPLRGWRRKLQDLMPRFGSETMPLPPYSAGQSKPKDQLGFEGLGNTHFLVEGYKKYWGHIFKSTIKLWWGLNEIMYVKVLFSDRHRYGFWYLLYSYMHYIFVTEKLCNTHEESKTSFWWYRSWLCHEWFICHCQWKELRSQESLVNWYFSFQWKT